MNVSMNLRESDGFRGLDLVFDCLVVIVCNTDPVRLMDVFMDRLLVRYKVFGLLQAVEFNLR